MELAQAGRANVFTLEHRDVLRAVTEDAGRLILLQHDGGSVNIDLQGVLLRDVQGSSQFDGQDDTPQFVYPAYNSSGFHLCSTSFLIWRSTLSLRHRTGDVATRTAKIHKKYVETS